MNIDKKTIQNLFDEIDNKADNVIDFKELLDWIIKMNI